MPTTCTAILIDQLHRAFDGEPWHGPSVRMLLQDVSVASALIRPGPEVHSIAEIVAHMTSWVAEVTRRLAGQPAADPIEGDWPIPRATDAEGWVAMHLELAESMARLTGGVAGFPEARWDDLVGGARDGASGAGVTYQQTVLGLVQHLAYHGGQVAILRKLVD